MSTTEIGRRLKQARLNAGLTQKEIADKLGITYQAISNYERGTNRVDTDTLSKMCSIYGIRISDLLTTPAWTPEMFQEYRSATAARQLQLLDLWGTPAELIGESNNRREPDPHPLSPEDELVLYKFHRGLIIADLTAAEVELIHKFRALSDDSRGRVWNSLEYEYRQKYGEKANSSPKEA